MKKNGFTLLEIMVTVTIIGLITAFVVPGFERALRKQTERMLASQLIALDGANKIYKAKNGTYLIHTGNWLGAPPTATRGSTGPLGDALGLSLPSFKLTTTNGVIRGAYYHYQSNADGSVYWIHGEYTAPGGQFDPATFELALDSALPIGANNPCCSIDRSGGGCLTRPACGGGTRVW